MPHKTIFLILVTGNTLWSPYAGICTRWGERLPRGWGQIPSWGGMGRGLRRGSPQVMHTYKAGGKHGKSVLTLAQ